jgi:hypothetical protein
VYALAARLASASRLGKKPVSAKRWGSVKMNIVTGNTSRRSVYRRVEVVSRVCRVSRRAAWSVVG